MVKKLFEDPGSKIKAIALIIFWINLIISIIVGLIILLRIEFYQIYDKFQTTYNFGY